MKQRHISSSIPKSKVKFLNPDSGGNDENDTTHVFLVLMMIKADFRDKLIRCFCTSISMDLDPKDRCFGQLQEQSTRTNRCSHIRISPCAI
jgi:hypothetical protein